MNTAEPSGSRTELTFLLICALITAALGVAALFGWILEWPLLASYGVGLIPMAPSTAALFVLLGVVTCLRARTPLSSCAYRTSVAAGSLVAMVTLPLLVLSSLNIHLDIEHLGMDITGTVDGARMGHMAPVTAFCFLLASVSFLASLSRSATRLWRADLALGSAGVLLGTCFVFLLAYLFGTPLLYGGRFIPPALGTVLAFITLGLALMVLARRSPGLLRRLLEHGSQTWVPFGLLFLVLAAGIITIGYLSYRNFEQQFRAEAERELSTITELKAGTLVQWRKERLGDGGVLFKNASFSALVRRFLEQPADSDAQRQLQGWLRSYRMHSGYDQARLLDTQGVTRLSTPDRLGPVSVATLRAASETLRSGRVTIQDLYRNEHDQRIYLSVQVPIFDELDATRPLGVVILRINPAAYLYPLIQLWPTPSPTAETMLVRRDGDTALFLNELRYDRSAALTVRIPLAQTDIPAVKALLGQTGIVEGSDYRGVPVLAAVQAVPDSPWFIVTKIDAAEVFAPLRERLWLTVALIGALLLGAGAGVVLIGRQQRMRFYREKAESAEALQVSEHRYRELFESSSDALLLYASDTSQVIDANDMALVLFGYQRDEFLTKTSSDLSAEPEETSCIIRELQSKPGQVISVPLRLLRKKDGTVFPVEFTARLLDWDGQPVILAAYRDIAERKQAEEEQARLLHILDASLNELYVFDAESLRFEYVNRGALLNLGYTSEAMRTMTPMDLKPEFTEVSFRQAIAPLFLHELEQLLIRTIHRRADGSVYPVEVHLQLIELSGRRAFLAVILDITERKRAEEALANSELRLREAQRIAQLGSWELDLVANRLIWSDEVFRMFEIDPSHFGATYEAFVAAIHPEDRTLVDEAYTSSVRDRVPYDITHRLQMPDGRIKFVHERCETIYDTQDKPIRSIGTVQNITEREQAENEKARLEAQVRQSQKMEAVGQLAGGIAHDFNNLLTVILGNQQLLEGMLKDQPEASELLQDASKAAWRGAELCKRVLAFSRRQKLSPESIAVNDLVEGMDKLLRRTLGQLVEVHLELGSDLEAIVVDPGQLENAILNLALNAHDAMPEGGTLSIRTIAFATDEHYFARHPDVPAGQYVMIEVSDTGQGMTPDVVARVFEPFFTTKEVGKGSGLGLSMVYGFLKQSDGHARIYSEPGVGTSVKLYFPATPSLTATRRLQLQLPVQLGEAPGGSERILVVEDDAEVRATITAMLSKLGYAVWEANSGAAGLEVLHREGKNIELLLSDVVMPGGMDGYELSKQARALFPDLKVVLISGFARNHTRNGHVPMAGVAFLNKPFRKDELARLLRKVLDA